jgi:hypothetical protein
MSNEKTGKRPPRLVETIDALLSAPVDIIENGKARKATTLEAIVLQLWRQHLAGDLRASAILLKYQEYAKQTVVPEVDISFADSDYTRALAGQPVQGDASDEQ